MGVWYNPPMSTRRSFLGGLLGGIAALPLAKKIKVEPYPDPSPPAPEPPTAVYERIWSPRQCVTTTSATYPISHVPFRVNAVRAHPTYGVKG